MFELFYLEESMGEVQGSRKIYASLCKNHTWSGNLRLNFHVLFELFSLFALALLQYVLQLVEGSLIAVGYPLEVLSVTVRICPFKPGWTSVTTASGQE